jgi:hypothetical protein
MCSSQNKVRNVRTRGTETTSVWLYVSAMLLSICFLLVILMFADKIDGIQKVVYNCELAEISPDFPIEVKNECRKLRSKK